MKKSKNFLPARLMASIMKASPIPCVDVMFLNETKTKTLLFKRNNKPAKGLYFAMGGRIWKNETFIKTALRKAKEELNITLSSQRLIGPFVGEEIWKSSEFPGVSYHAIPIYFFYILTDKESGAIACDAQHSDFKWFSIDDNTLDAHIKSRLAHIPHA